MLYKRSRYGMQASRLINHRQTDNAGLGLMMSDYTVYNNISFCSSTAIGKTTRMGFLVSTCKGFVLPSGLPGLSEGLQLILHRQTH